MKAAFAVLILVTVIPCTAVAAALTRQDCHGTDDPEKLADCFEKNIYDACIDAGGSVGDVRCVVMKQKVAERRINRATKLIAEKSKNAGVVNRTSINDKGEVSPPHDHTVAANNLWRQYVWEHCQLLNELYLVEFASGERLGFCMARMMEERAVLLEKIASGLREANQ